MSEEQVGATKISAALAKFKVAKGAVADSIVALLKGASWAGSPRDLAVILGTGFGAGSYFRLADKSAASAITPMADYLASLQLPFVPDARTVVAGLVAITCYAAVRVFVDFRSMDKASTFEQRRVESAAEAKLFSRYLDGSIGTYDSIMLADLATSAQQAYEDSFGSLPRFSDDGLALVRNMRSVGALEVEIEAALAQGFHEDARLIDQVSRTLADDYLMLSAQAGKVAVDLVLLHDGDTPLLRSRLASRVLPPGWITQFGFDPKSVVGEVRLKDRPSETAKLFASMWSRVTEKFGQRNSVPHEKGSLGPRS